MTPVLENGETTLNGRKEEEEVVSYDINLPYRPPTEADLEHAKARTEYPEYLPSWEKVWFDEMPDFHHEDPALRAKGTANLLKGVDAKMITPKMGTILSGIKLEELDATAKNELALLISQRKIVVLRDQKSFLDAGPGFQQEFMAYFGKPNYQPVTGSVKGYPGFHIIHRDRNENEMANFFKHKMTSTLWHQDVSYEAQPPGMYHVVSQISHRTKPNRIHHAWDPSLS